MQQMFSPIFMTTGSVFKRFYISFTALNNCGTASKPKNTPSSKSFHFLSICSALSKDGNNFKTPTVGKSQAASMPKDILSKVLKLYKRRVHASRLILSFLNLPVFTSFRRLFIRRLALSFLPDNLNRHGQFIEALRRNV